MRHDDSRARTRAWALAARLVLVLSLVWSTRAGAQAANEATLSGRVTTRDGAPLAGARLQARDTESENGGPAALSDAAGRYSLRLRASREYALSVEKPGFVGGTVLVRIPAGSAGVARDVRLASAREAAATLDSLVVRAPPRTPEPVRRGDAPGAALASLPGSISTRFPGEPGDLLASAGLSGQFVPVAGGLSIAGQAPSANRTTLDGAGFDAGSLPPEALAAAGVFTHPFDVSRGQFTGGEIAGRTMSGTNLWGGALRVALDEPRLRYGGSAAAGRGRGTRIGGGGGGPIATGRLFVYGAGQFSSQESTGEPLNPADSRLRGYGIAADSARRLLQIVSGLGLGDKRGGPDGGTLAGAGLVRFDYLVNPRHSLTLRLDGRGRESSGYLNSPFSASGGGLAREMSGGLMLQALSKLGRGITHDASVYRSRGYQRSAAALETPTGRVWVHSDLGDAGTGSSVLYFAGDALAWPDEDRTALEVADRVVIPLARGKHRLQLGGLYTRERVRRSAPGDRFGTFTFASLADLEAGRPFQYTRWLGSGSAGLVASSWAGYVGDLWTPRPALRVTYGIRAERNTYGGPSSPDSGSGPAAVPPASPWSVSPRAGFTWTSVRPAAEWIVRGGAGRFRGAAPTRALAALLAEPGMSGGVRLVCVGAAVPVPRWESYRDDPGSIPRECARDTPEQSSDRPGASGFSPRYGLPSVWHSSLEVRWRHRPSSTSLEATLGASRGSGLPLASDLNLVDDPAFRLAGEGGRPVFVAPGAIDPSSGRIVLPGSRRSDDRGVVRVVDASGRSAAEQLSVTASRLTDMGLVQAYYTYSRSRDDASALQGPLGAIPTTAGDPRRPSRAPADFERRHVFQLSLDRDLASWSSLTLYGRVLSGRPFTPMVDADVNGDGFTNDRAFVFGAADGELGGGMAALLDAAPAGARDCLRRQLGRIAGRNSCRTPWNPQLDVQLNLRPGGIRGRTAFMVVAQNATAALDRLLHGADALRGWGQDPQPDPVLLRVTGFDPAERRFRYQVNPSFGADAVSRIPFTIRIQGRVALGADPATQALVASVSDLQASMPPADVKREILRQWANVPALVLAYSEPRRLGLAESQVQRLRVAADSIALGIGTLAGALGDGPSPDENATPADLLAQAQRLLTSGFDTAREVLTRDQWSRLPRVIRMPPHAALPISAQSGIILGPDL
jgi:hypothetical protein